MAPASLGRIMHIMVSTRRTGKLPEPAQRRSRLTASPPSSSPPSRASTSTLYVDGSAPALCLDTSPTLLLFGQLATSVCSRHSGPAGHSSAANSGRPTTGVRSHQVTSPASPSGCNRSASTNDCSSRPQRTSRYEALPSLRLATDKELCDGPSTVVPRGSSAAACHRQARHPLQQPPLPIRRELGCGARLHDTSNEPLRTPRVGRRRYAPACRSRPSAASSSMLTGEALPQHPVIADASGGQEGSATGRRGTRPVGLQTPPAAAPASPDQNQKFSGRTSSPTPEDSGFGPGVLPRGAFQEVLQAPPAGPPTDRQIDHRVSPVRQTGRVTGTSCRTGSPDYWSTDNLPPARECRHTPEPALVRSAKTTPRTAYYGKLPP